MGREQNNECTTVLIIAILFHIRQFEGFINKWRSIFPDGVQESRFEIRASITTLYIDSIQQKIFGLALFLFSLLLRNEKLNIIK